MTTMRIRDTSLYVEVAGHGPPLVLMHGGPGLDHVSLTPFRELADRHTVVLYDHRCNGRSTGAPVTSMTFENLTADADALREQLGFERWAVLGHSFGGHVALEYVLRYPDRVTQLILLDTAGDARWSQEHAAEVLADRGFGPKTVAVARRFYNGRIAPKDFVRASFRLLPAYDHRFSLVRLGRELLAGGWRMKTRPEALIFGGQMMRGWTVMDRLGEIRMPTLVLAGHDDFLFPPEGQALLAAGIPNAQLRIIERAGHNPQSERPAETLAAVARFLDGGTPERASPGRERDPAERGVLRYFYRDWRPTRLGQFANRVTAWWASAGLPPSLQQTLEVRGRTSGRIRATPVVIATVEGERHLVSMLGPDSEWVKNVVAADGAAVLRHGTREAVRLVPVPPDRRARVLREYVRIASSGRRHFPVAPGAPLSEFAAIADRYPVFLIERR